MHKLVLGGSAGGKSEFAENLAVSLNGKTNPLIYIATMQPFGSEASARIAKHREMRASKGFETIERYTDLSGVEIKPNSTVLLECIGNLLANEMFNESNLVNNAIQNVLRGIDAISDKSKHLVVVSNDIFFDGIEYDKETTAYQNALAELNKTMAYNFSTVVEIVCGIPIYHKGGSFASD